MRRGFTLIEALVASFMLLVAMGIVAMVSSEYSRLSRSSRTQEAVFEVSQRALGLMASESSEAVRGVSPLTAAATSTLSFEKVDLRAARFPATAPAAFVPQQPLLRITYLVANEVLIRQVDDGQNVASEQVARGVTGLSAVRHPRHLNLRVSVRREQTVLTLERDVYLWTGRW